MKKILIAGGSGLLGLNSTLYLSNIGYEIFASSHNKSIKDIEFAQFFEIDLTNFKNSSDLINLIKPDLVMNFAGLTNVEECERNPDLARRLNVDICGNLSKISSNLDIPFLHMSTDHLFSNSQNSYDEEDATCPINIYSKTKLESEKLALSKNNKSLVIRANFFCTSTIYKSSFIDNILINLNNGDKVELFDDVFFSPILFSYLLDYALTLIKKNHSGIYHVSSDEKISKYKFGCLLSNFLKMKSELIVPISIDDKDLVRRPYNMALNNTKLKKTLNIQIPTLTEQFKNYFDKYNYNNI